LPVPEINRKAFVLCNLGGGIVEHARELNADELNPERVGDLFQSCSSYGDEPQRHTAWPKNDTIFVGLNFTKY